MNIEQITYISILAGIGLFLFGMNLMEESLRAIAGGSFKSFLRQQTGKVHKAVISGALVTAVLQSSSLVTLFVMSLTGAGIISLKSGIGMILGANLGTTSTGWLVSVLGFKMEIGKLILPFLAIGGIGIAILKNSKWAGFFKLLLGFSLIFLGISYMKEGFEGLTESLAPEIFNSQPKAILLLMGFILAAALHSSSASMMIYLSSLSAGIISIEQAAILAIGSDLGTTTTGLLGTIGANNVRRQTGWAQFYFNVISATLALIMSPLLLYFIIEKIGISDSLTQLFTFHSLFNLMGILLIMPFINQFTNVIAKIVGNKEIHISKFITQTSPAESHASIDALFKDTSIFLEQSSVFNAELFNSEINVINISNKYINLKKYENELFQYNNEILKNKLNSTEVNSLNLISECIRYCVLSAKDLKDIAHNISEMKESENKYITNFITKICEEQNYLYANINTIKINIEIVKEEEIFELKYTNKNNFSNNTSQMVEILQKKGVQELDFSSHSNAIREIHNSNDYILEALTLFKKAETIRKNNI